MDFSRFICLPVYATDFCGEEEEDIIRAGIIDGITPEFLSQMEKAVSQGFELLTQFFEPCRVRKITGADNGDPLYLGPSPEAIWGHIFTCGT